MNRAARKCSALRQRQRIIPSRVPGTGSPTRAAQGAGAVDAVQVAGSVPSTQTIPQEAAYSRAGSVKELVVTMMATSASCTA